MKFKSQVYTQASGSIGGVTYSHNRGGLYTRARSIPVNPGSAFQTAVRNALSQLTAAWTNTLTSAQRAAWDLWAENTPQTDSLGDPINIGGLGAYVQSNVPRLQAGEPRVDDGPTIFTLADLTAPSVASTDAANDEVDVSYTNTDAWATEDDGALLLYVSRPQSPGVNFFKGPYRLAAVVQGDSVTPPTSPVTVTCPFPIASGQRIFVQARASRADGRLSSAIRFRSDVA